jgi:hypothetical protein
VENGGIQKKLSLRVSSSIRDANPVPNRIVSNPSFADLPIAGLSSGIFTNPTGLSGMVTTGVGSSSFTWGDAASFGTGPSSLRFTGTSFSGTSDVPFVFGELDYFNGTIASGTGADAVDLEVNLAFTAPSGIVQDFTYNLTLVNTPNTGTAEEMADFVYLPTTMPVAYFTEGGVNYTLEFLGFGAITGGGFTTVDSFHVLEGSSASAELLGQVTEQVVPVPGAVLLGVLGLGVAGLKLRKRA